MLRSHMHFSHMGALPNLLFTAAACFSLSGCGVASENSEGQNSNSGEWRLQRATDSLSGVEGIAAESAIQTEQGIADIKISCLGDKQLSYEITFRSGGGTQPIIAWPAISDPTLQASFDGEETIPVKVKQPRPMNTVLLRDEDVVSTLKTAGRIGEFYWENLDGSLSKFAVMRFALAKELRLKIALMSGDGVVIIDQTTPTIRSVLNQCGVDPSIIAQAAEEQAAADQKLMDDHRNFQASEYGSHQTPEAQENQTNSLETSTSEMSDTGP